MALKSAMLFIHNLPLKLTPRNEKMLQNPVNPAKSSQNLSPEKRAAAAAALLAHSVDFRLKKGVVAQVAADVCCSVRTIERLWERTVVGLKAGRVDGHQAQRKERCGRKRLYSPDNKNKLWERIERIALSDRMNLRTLAERLVCRERRSTGTSLRSSFVATPHFEAPPGPQESSRPPQVCTVVCRRDSHAF